MTKRAVTPPSPWVVSVMIAPVMTKSSKLFLPPSRFFLKTSTSVFKFLQSKNLFFTLMARSGFSGTRKMTQSAEATWHAKMSHVGAMKPNLWIHRPLVNRLKTPPMNTSICMIAVDKIERDERSFNQRCQPIWGKVLTTVYEPSWSSWSVPLRLLSFGRQERGGLTITSPRCNISPSQVTNSVDNNKCRKVIICAGEEWKGTTHLSKCKKV